MEDSRFRCNGLLKFPSFVTNDVCEVKCRYFHEQIVNDLHNETDMKPGFLFARHLTGTFAIAFLQRDLGLHVH